ncbi:hypothetical protein LCGC14_2229860 [marine sediment metagenome]|uniref:Uncharacterized protein n=1 Tax=marine sediment metagenome TaxID=412755 RepID=A0A0F9FL50_9ZZZZ
MRDECYIINEAEKKTLYLTKEFLAPFKNDADKLEYYASLLYILIDMFFFESGEGIDTARINKIRELKPTLFEKYGLNVPLGMLRTFNLIN